MNPDIFKIIKYAESIGINIHINTNAFLINDVIAQKLIDSHVTALSISLDGSNPKTHDYLRGVPQTFNHAINAIKTLRKISPHKPRIFINTVIMKPNVGELDQLINLATTEKTDGITFQCLLPNLGPGEKITNITSIPLWPDKKKTLKAIKSILTQSKSNPIVLNKKSELELARNYYTDPRIVDQYQCAAGINNFIIDHEGNVNLCFGFSPVGNIFKQSPQKIWQNSLATKQRGIIRKCKAPCKIIACNRVNLDRADSVFSDHF